MKSMPDQEEQMADTEKADDIAQGKDTGTERLAQGDPEDVSKEVHERVDEKVEKSESWTREDNR